MRRLPTPCGMSKPRIDGSLPIGEIANAVIKKCYACPVLESGKENESAVIFLPHAWDNLCAATGYGKWASENELESQYFLEGYFFKDEQARTTTVVTNVFAALSASRSRTSAELYSKDAKFNAYDFIEQQEEELEKYASCGKDVQTGAELNPFFEAFGPPHRIGFGHTHPNLGVFFSSVDRTSVFAIEGEPWITMVADPRRREVLVTVGKDLSPVHLIIFKAGEETKAKAFDVLESSADGILSKVAELLAQSKKDGAEVSFKISGHSPRKVKFKGSVTTPRNKEKRG